MSDKILPTNIRLTLQPAPAWIAILALVFLCALCILAGAGKILNLAFPAGAFAVGLFLYFRYPVLYIGFSWWMWFLTPLVRRLADYRSGFSNPSPILLAPFLVTLITLITLWQNLPKTARQGSLPFVLSIAGIFYSFLVGFILKSPVEACLALLEWLAPVLLGYHLFLNWRNYPDYRQNIQRVFVWGVLVMGVYGIIQYVTMPEWDRFWLINTGFTTSGSPEPFGFRVWSTLNSTEPFAAMMAASLLLLLSNNQQKVLGVLASVAGYSALLLTFARSSWLGWLAGLLTLISSLKPKHRIRLIITLLAILILVIPLSTLEPFSDKVSERLETFSSLEDDNSFQNRQAYFKMVFGDALTSVVGVGIGGVATDNSILVMLFQLGWIGTIFYMGGMSLLVFSLCQSSEVGFDTFAVAARAAVISALVRLPINVPMLGVSGTVLWGFLGIGLAAHQYHHHQRQIKLRESLSQNQLNSLK
ncbi:O-antigen ligase domain-containing protein [Coleofasciculus chthonoplastes]|uniref:O-antigen ligase domain-containing protein n=1 Tax=Coleofasciculus chthonoplastes TaxID=64178 RepID=UPI003304276A